MQVQIVKDLSPYIDKLTELYNEAFGKEEKSFQDVVDQIICPILLIDDPNLNENFLQHCILKKDEEIIGYFSIVKFSETVATGWNMFIKKSERRKGYAQYLLEEISKITKYKTCFLYVDKINTNAISFYEKCGFKIISEYNKDKYFMKWESK